MATSTTTKHWIARVLIAIVFAINMYCAVSFFFNPAAYVGAYQLDGEGAQAALSGLGVTFAMWNATYIPILVLPHRFRAVFAVVLAQQVIGLAGESWILSTLGASQAILAASITRFIIFDAIGLVLLLIAFLISLK
ncbi:MAG: hypothetical protein IJ113_07680 [Eggerthellaceae bacterium]|nr:hypothetical protein [Eggerthellaceae bacterium]